MSFRIYCPENDKTGIYSPNMAAASARIEIEKLHLKLLKLAYLSPTLGYRGKNGRRDSVNGSALLDVQRFYELSY